MNKNEIINIIRKKIINKGYSLEERKSVSTTSTYFKISSGKYSLLFRIADHGTKDNVITLRIDKKNTNKSVENFIDNRLNDLGQRILKGVLGY